MKLRLTIGLGLILFVCANLGSAQDLPVTDGLLLWLDATDPATVINDDGDPAGDEDFIDGWLDKSGNDFNAVPAADPNIGLPVYTTDGINGLPSVRFFGEFNDGLEIDGLDLQRPYTAFIANQYWGDTRGRTLQSQDINWLLGLWAGNYGHYAEGWVNTRQPAAEVNRPYVADAIGTETESFFMINDVDWTQNSSPAGVPGALGIAGGGQFGGEVSDADVSEIIIYDRVLSDVELGSVRTHLYTKYGTEPVDGPPTPPELEVRKGSIEQFRAASDLDFSGEFLYAVNAGGPADNPDGDPLVIGDVTFADGTIAAQPDLDDIGFKMNTVNEAGMWYGDPDYGDAVEDDNLEFMMRSIRWSVPAQDGILIDLDVEAGESYKMQMLFAEEAWDRGFNILIEEEEVVEDFVIHLAQGGMANRPVGVVYTHELVAGDDELNIQLGGDLVGVPDNNPLIQAFTLEKIDDIMTIVGDCNGDGVLNADDLACISTIDERDAVLGELNTLPGDLDGNGDVAFPDFLTLSTNFNSDLPGYQDGNINLMDGIDFADFLILSTNFNKTLGEVAAVPEPGGLALGFLAVSGLPYLRRRRR